MTNLVYWNLANKGIDFVLKMRYFNCWGKVNKEGFMG